MTRWSEIKRRKGAPQEERAMPMPPTITTRDGLREAIRFDLASALEEVGQRVSLEEGDAWNNVPVVTRKDLDAAIAKIFDEPLPPTSETVAEVSTPATIEVSAECPRCFIATTIEMAITPELRVNSDGSSIHLRGKAKAKTHVCGQLELPEAKRAAAVDGQEALPLEDVVEDEGTGEPMEGIEVAEGETATLTQAAARGRGRRPNGHAPEGCPAPGCIRTADHRGAHRYAEDGDSDLLPA